MKWLHSMASVIELDKEKVANKQKSKMNIELLSQSSSWTRSRATSSCKNRDSSHSTILSPTYPAHSSRTSACRSRRVQQRQQWWQHRHQELAAGNSNNSSSNNMTLIMNMSTTLLSILSPARRPACCSATTINCHIRTRSYETSCKEYVSPITWILIYLLQFISQQKKKRTKIRPLSETCLATVLTVMLRALYSSLNPGTESLTKLFLKINKQKQNITIQIVNLILGSVHSSGNYFALLPHIVLDRGR